MAIKVEEVFTVTSVHAVEWIGTLEYHDGRGWCVTEILPSHGAPHHLEDWFDKFSGRMVKIRIEHLTGPHDDGSLLKNTDRANSAP